MASAIGPSTTTLALTTSAKVEPLNNYDNLSAIQKSGTSIGLPFADVRADNVVRNRDV